MSFYESMNILISVSPCPAFVGQRFGSIPRSFVLWVLFCGSCHSCPLDLRFCCISFDSFS